MSITASTKLVRAKIVELMGGPVLRVNFKHPLYAVLSNIDGGDQVFQYDDPEPSCPPYEIWTVRPFEHLGVTFLSSEFSDYGGGSDPYFYFKVGSLPKGYLKKVAKLEAERAKELGVNRYGFAPHEIIR